MDVKTEPVDDIQSDIQYSNTRMSPAYVSVSSQNVSPYYEIEINEMNVKKELAGVDFEPFHTINATPRQATFFDTEKFITEIERNECIWNVKLPEYSNKQTKQQAWADIADFMNEKYSETTLEEKKQFEEDLQKKWKGIRSSFSRELSKSANVRSGSGASQRKQYVYFEHLNFLLPVVTSKTTTSNAGVPSDVDTTVQENCEDPKNNEKKEDSLNHSRPFKKRRTRKVSDEGENLMATLTTSLEKSVEENGDDSRYFLLSLLPQIRQVPSNKILQCRMEVMGVISKYLTPDECLPRQDSHPTQPGSPRFNECNTVYSGQLMSPPNVQNSIPSPSLSSDYDYSLDSL